jgi:hypothetical protein
MRRIDISRTDAGWEMLINGVPSPRFTRYMRYLHLLRKWIATVVHIFVVGPAAVLALVAAVDLAAGRLVIDLTGAPNWRTATVTFRLGPMRHPAPCDRAKSANGQRTCSADPATAGREAADVKALLLIGYLLGAAFAANDRLRRRPK